MRKLYIPTTTFNFNNILSSESISPKAYYERRGFGYKRWMEIPENNVDNVVLLYDEAFAFERPISDIEDHPMLIEFETDKDYPQVAEGVYYSDSTIYFSPWNTRFIFFCEKDKMITLSLSDSSLETKMLPIYKGKLVVETYTPKTTNQHLEVCIPLCEEGIEYDFRLNKMKGLLYGYYIGVRLSSTSELVEKYNSLQELYNIFSSVLSSENHSPTIIQEDRMIYLISEIQKDIPYIKYLEGQLGDSKNVIAVIDKLESMGVRFPGYVGQRFLRDAIINGTSDNNFAINWVKEYFSQLKQLEKKSRVYLSANSEEIIVSDLYLSKIANLSQKDAELVKVWINNVLIKKEFNGNTGSYKEQLSDEITLATREILQSDWESDPIRQQLNSMRKYIRGQEVDFLWSNGIASSISAVLAKGNDWEQLYSFLKSKSLYDYRLAFAFYGELIGFANLTRDFTDHLLNSSDRNYVAEVYKEFMGQLLGIESIISNQQKEGSCIMSNGTENRTRLKVEASLSSDGFEQLINNLISICKGASLDKHLYETYYKKYGLTYDFLSAIKEDKHFGRGKGVQKTIVKELERILKVSKGQTSKKQSVIGQQTILFDIDIIHRMNCFSGLSEKVKKRLLDNWNYTVKKNGYMTDEQIKHFVNLCKKEGRESEHHKELFNIFTDDLAKEFMREIKNEDLWRQ